METQKGVSGFHDTQEELEKVSSVKSGLDEQKGKSLDEISDMVNKLSSNLLIDQFSQQYMSPHALTNLKSVYIVYVCRTTTIGIGITLSNSQYNNQ